MKSRGFVFGIGHRRPEEPRVLLDGGVSVFTDAAVASPHRRSPSMTRACSSSTATSRTQAGRGRRLERRLQRHERRRRRRCSSRTRSTGTTTSTSRAAPPRTSRTSPVGSGRRSASPRTRTTSPTRTPRRTRRTATSSSTSASTGTPATARRRSASGSCRSDFGLVNADGAAGTFTGKHVNGDVLVQIDFENGGANPVIRIYEWQNGLTLVSDGRLCAVPPRVTTAAPSPRRASRTRTGSSTTRAQPGLNDDIPAGGMVEGGINLTALGLDDGCFTSFLAETRSSPSPESTLSDYAFGNFELCAKPEIETHVRQQGNGEVSVINKGDSVFDRAILTGDNGVVDGQRQVLRLPQPRGRRQARLLRRAATRSAAPWTSSTARPTATTFTPTQLGYYCFRVEYTPAAGSKYLADRAHQPDHRVLPGHPGRDRPHQGRRRRLRDAPASRSASR